MYVAKIVDTETTGITSNDRMFEYAHIALPALEELQTTSPVYAHPKIEQERSIWNPGVPIHPQATTIHGYTLEGLLEHPPVEEFNFVTPNYMIGHNIDFDARFLGEPDTKKICTIRLAKLVWPKTSAGITSYKLTYLIENLVENGEALTKEAHGALQDCWLTFILLGKILEKLPRITSWEELYQAQLPKSKPAPKGKKLPDVMPFGKHRGELIIDIPRDYLGWLLKQELSATLREAIQGAYGKKVA